MKNESTIPAVKPPASQKKGICIIAGNSGGVKKNGFGIDNASDTGPSKTAGAASLEIPKENADSALGGSYFMI